MDDHNTIDLPNTCNHTEWSNYIDINEGMNKFTLYEIDEDTQMYGIDSNTQSYPVYIYGKYSSDKAQLKTVTINQIPNFQYNPTTFSSSYAEVDNSISSIDLAITETDVGSEITLDSEVIISQGTSAGTVVTKSGILLKEGENIFEIKVTYTLYGRVVYTPSSTSLIIFRNYANNSDSSGGSSGGSGGGTFPDTTTPVDTTVSGNTVVVSVSETQLASLFKMLQNTPTEVKLAIIKIPKVTGLDNYGIQLPYSAFTASNSSGIRLETDIGSLTLMDTMLQNVVQTTALQNVKFNMGYVDTTILSQEAQTAIGNHPIISLNMELDGTTSEWNNPDSPVIVSVPYTPTAEELANPELITVYYIDGQGNLNAIPNATYDATNKCMVFTTTHFSDYAIAYNPKTFTDITDTVVKHAVDVLAAKNVISGKTNTLFAPNDTITRAEFITMLSRAFEFNKPFINSFTDVDSSKYYYKPVGMAKEMNVVSGIGKNEFDPNGTLNKEQVEIIINNLVKAKGLKIDNVTLMALLSGVDKADRGECAVLIYNLM